ncbi:MAG: stilbene synthase [Opitutae bacterium]|nr:stilbene synthase [Opitutae bacterium]
MHLHALATAVPPHSFTQEECWEKVAASPLREQLSRRSLLTLRAVLTRDTSIATRHFALADLEQLLASTADDLNAHFRTAAPALAGAALTRALDRAGAVARDLDALLVCTCTGYLCPGVSSYVAEQLGLRPDAFLQDLVGLGCGAAIPMLRAADALCAARPDALVATVAVEICSAAFYLDDDPGVLVSACLFSDGAAAALWRGAPGATGLQVRGFSTTHRPAERDKLRFEQRDGRLRNLLHPAVPKIAADAVRELFARENGRPLARVISHSGGRDVLDALEPVLPGHSLDASRAALRAHGNMSSPSVLFALEEALRADRPRADGDWWIVSFGAGFSAHACRLALRAGV